MGVKRFVEFLELSCSHAFPLIKQRKKPNLLSSKEINKLSKLQENKRKKYKRLKDSNRFLAQEALGELNEVSDQLRKLILKHKNESYKEFCSKQDLNHAYKLNKMFKMAMNRKPFSNIVKDDGNFTESVEETLDVLINKFYPDKNHSISNTDNLIDNIDDNIQINLIELQSVVNNFSNNKAPGIDEITADIIKNLPLNITCKLLSLYNGLIRIKYLPKIWKIGKVIPIPKPGSNKNKSAKDFRPITLLSLLSKIFEKILINRIELSLYVNKQIDDRQFGFCKQKSTIDALHNLRNFSQHNINKRKSIAIISFDISGAFDNASWKIIIDSLVERNCPTYLVKCINSYFSDRKVIISHGDITIEKNATQGCPQGSCCGPTLWNILFDNLFRKLKDKFKSDQSDNELNQRMQMIK